MKSRGRTEVLSWVQNLGQNQIPNQDLYSAICSRGFRGAVSGLDPQKFKRFRKWVH